MEVRKGHGNQEGRNEGEVAKENGQMEEEQMKDGQVQEKGSMVDWEDIGIEEVEEESVAEGKSMRRKFRLTGSMGARIVAFFLLAVSCLAGVGAGILSLYMESEGFYTEKRNTVMMNVIRRECVGMAYEAAGYIESENIKEAKRLCQESNFSMELVDVEGEEETIFWSSWDGDRTELSTEIYLSFSDVRVNGHILDKEKLYLVRIYVDPNFSKDDNLKEMAELVSFLYENRFFIIWLAAAGSILCLSCFLFLMCSAGHRNGRTGIVPGALTTIHLDVLTVLFAGAAWLFVRFLMEVFSYRSMEETLMAMPLAATVLVVWMTFYFMDFAIRVKMGNCWRYSLIFLLFRGTWRTVHLMGKGLVSLLQGIPMILTTLIVYLGICILEFMGVMAYMRNGGVVLWALEKIILLPVIMYIALTCQKFLQASRALADGQEDYRVDTKGMFGDFREHGENLNSLGLGISKAVEERIKSERMKTELISNVSHDLKTPLTSIINYADLIWEEVKEGGDSAGKGPTEKLAEYAEVLVRQSKRLKKLMEDLMEASKATTGNLDVNLEPCEAGVLLSQAVGEYQQKMEEKELELITRQPESAVIILADGRHLWRIFENLLNNICKYAQEKSRVYLSVELKGKRALIVFRNMSKYALEVSAEELEERFVRGDKSRHMEGNGLGLSIAKSLAELQGGQMELVIDGDLFKVVLSFPVVE